MENKNTIIKTKTKKAPFNYEAFEKGTGHMSAYALIKDGSAVGRIVIKPPRDGAGRLYAFAQVWGVPMVRGSAGGYGYDKAGAALSVALKKLEIGEEHLRLDDELSAIETLREIGNSHDQYDQIRWAIRDAGYSLARAL
jgi:hypothetical protein